jgi:hypothetical protein
MSFKNLYFFLCFAFYFSQSVHSQSNPNEINFADSYFEKKEYKKAKEIYYKLIKEKVHLRKNALLKLAFIHEKEFDITRTLYFLNLYYEQNPSERVLKKMNELALEHNIIGYEITDFFLLLLIIKQYSYVLILLLATLGVYIFTVFVVKKYKNEKILLKHKIVFLLYLAGILFLLNISRFYSQGIVHNENVSVREDPSSAASTLVYLPAGQRINIFGSEDIWLRVWYQNQFFYVNKANIWLIN